MPNDNRQVLSDERLAGLASVAYCLYQAQAFMRIARVKNETLGLGLSGLDEQPITDLINACTLAQEREKT